MVETTLKFLASWSGSIWAMLLDSAPFFVAGLILAGLLWLFINEKNLGRIIRKDGMKSVFRAALIGVPLPLCSCSVLPVATQLRRAGAGKAATISFLVSTPESGVDSILLTYSLTDPLLTVARPVTAFLTAMVAGFVETVFPGKAVPTVETVASSCDCHCDCDIDAKDKSGQGMIGKVMVAIRYAFTNLLKDLAPYLFVGFVLAGLVGVVFGPESGKVPSVLTFGWLGYIGAILIGLPLYVCATSSTPLAAVLLAAGVSPGVILVFLMVGPATNIASMAVVRKIVGTWATVRYVVVVVTIAVLSGIALDELYRKLGTVAHYRSGIEASHSGLVYQVSAVLLAAFILYYSLQWLNQRVRNLVLNRT